MWPNTENSIVIYFVCFFILCLFAYVLMSRVHLVDLKNPDQKRKALDQGDPHSRFIAKVAERSGNILSLAPGVLAVRHSTFALCLMAVWT